jgi:hypothetical protein
MTTLWRSLSLGLLGIAVAAGSAQGADTPLLVAVEAAPGTDVGSADVRHLIATELGTPVVGAREVAATTAADILLVTVDAHGQGGSCLSSTVGVRLRLP